MHPNRRITIRDVAERASVSVATVSKVINGRYGVAARTSVRVRQAIDDLGYTAVPAPRNHRTNVLGVLVADFGPFSTTVLKGVADAVRGSGFEMVVYSAGGRLELHSGWERRYLSGSSGTLMDGAVLVTPTINDAGCDTALVTIDPHAGPATTPIVDADNYGGARAGVAHLVELGHKRIAMITGRADLHSAHARERGYRDVLAEAGLPVDDDLIQLGAFDVDIARQAAYRLLTLRERPSAIFAANDASALTAMEVAAELGLRVPGDLSVVGFDNLPESALAIPPLTTVEQPIRLMGRRAMEMLIRLVRQEPIDSPHIRLPTRLVRRQSTRPPADG